MNWEMIAAMGGIIFTLGCIFLAAAKSIFVTQVEYNDAVKTLHHKLYDENGIPIYLIKTDWEKSKDDRERRHDLVQRKLCEQMQAIQKAQGELNTSVNVLISRFDQEYGRMNKK